MRAVAIAEDRRLVTVEREPGEPGPGQALLEVAYCGICGSDLHFRDVPALFPAGTIPGHELSARILAVGEGVERWQPGDRVAVLPFAQCGECAWCRGGQEQVCPHAVAGGVGLGTGRPGGYAERMIADARMLFALPDAVDDRAGALSEPLAVAVRTVNLAAIAPDEPVMVLGAGTIGMLVALVLRERGYERATLVSRNPARTAHAVALGLPAATLDDVAATLDSNQACVFECAGSPAAAQLATQAARPLGKVMLVGISMEPLDLHAAPIVLKELELHGVLTYRRDEFAQAIELLAGGAIPVEGIVTSTAPLEGAEDAFQALTRRGTPELKILLDPRAGQ